MSQEIRTNVIIFPKITHDTSGEPIDVGFIDQGTYIEDLSLTAPKLILKLKDHGMYLKNTLQIKEYDELTLSISDTWQEDGGENFQETFVILTIKPEPNDIIKINCLAKPLFNMKTIADKTRIFSQRGVSEILSACSQGLETIMGKFAVVSNYHIIAGERPSTMLSQLAKEHGGHIWLCRGKLHMQSFKEMWAQEPVITFNEGKAYQENPILRYTRPSAQVEGQERNIRSFSGWDEKEGRLSISSAIKSITGLKSVPPLPIGAQTKYVLSREPLAKKTAIDFITPGRLFLTPGQMVKILWHMPDPQNPIDEGMPDKVVIESVAHWYSHQHFYSRVKGAVALEPYKS